MKELLMTYAIVGIVCFGFVVKWAYTSIEEINRVIKRLEEIEQSIKGKEQL